MRPDNRIRDFEIAQLKNQGWTLRAIGEVAELSCERVRQIVARVEATHRRRQNLIAKRVEHIEAGKKAPKKEYTIEYIISVMTQIQDQIGVI